jgi:WD40 repeat protein
MDTTAGCFQPIIKYATAAYLPLRKLAPKLSGKNISIMDGIQHLIHDHLLVVATTSHSLGIADINKSVFIRSWEAHNDRINSLTFTNIPEDNELANVFFSASEDGYVKIWDSRTCNMVSNISIVQLYYLRHS